MFLRNRAVRDLACWLVMVAQLWFLAGCRQDGGVHGAWSPSQAAPGSSTQSGFATVIFNLLRHSIETSGDPNTTAKLAVLDVRRDEFIQAVDRVLPPSQNQTIVSTLTTLTGFIGDGTVPRMTNGVKGILQLLLSDPQDPQGLTLEALARLQQTSGGVSNTENTLELLERLLEYPQLDQFFQAIAEIIRANDGVDDQGTPNGENDLVSDLLALVSRQLQAIQPGQAQSLSHVVDTLLSEVQIRGRPNLGAPAWAVRSDANGNPRVATDPASGLLYLPFVDANADGVADIDADGRPIDAAGQPIDIPAFGAPGSVVTGASYDQDGKATTGGGAAIYVYYDAKSTILSMVLMMVGDLLRLNVPSDLLAATDRMLDRDAHDNGTPLDTTDDYETFRPGPLGDLAWSGLEMLKYADGARVLWGLAELLRHDPAATEQMMIALRDVIRTLQNAQVTPPPGGNMALIDDLVPLLDTTFERQQNGTTAAREILYAFRTQYQRLSNLPASFAELMRYTDWQNRVPAGNGRKSVMEQILDLMDEANGCNSWPFGNMAEFYLDAMAGNKSILGIRIQPRMINSILQISFLRSLLCSRMSNNVAALQAFIDSGAMDAFYPIVKVFSDRHETRLLVDIMLTLRANYDTIRPLEPTVADVLASGAVNRMLDMVNLMNQVRIPQTGELVVDAVADLVATLVDDERVVYDRRGGRETSLVHLLVRPIDALSQLAQARGVQADLDRIMRNVIDVVFALDANGLLVNQGLVPLASALFTDLADSLPLTAQGRMQVLSDRQQQILDLLEGQDAVAVVDLLKMVDSSPSRQTLVDTLTMMFTPSTTAADDVFGALMKVLATALESKLDTQSMDQVMQFVGRAIDPARGYVQPIARGIAAIMRSSSGGFILSLLRNAVDSGPNGLDRRPASIVVEILDDVNAVGGASSPLTAADMRAKIQSMLDFMNDTANGLPHMYRLYGYTGP